MSEPADTATPPAITIVPLDGAKPRAGSITLDYPMSINGRPLNVIHLKRLSVGALGAYFDQLAQAQRADTNAQPDPFPGITDEDGVPIPADVLRALDPDDEDRLNEALLDFLPRRLRPEKQQPSASPLPGIGAPSASSSVPPPDGASPT